MGRLASVWIMQVQEIKYLMEKIKKVSAHGGARPGSGRKAKGTHGPKVRAVCVRISEEIYQELEILKDRGWSASALLEGAVEAIYNSTVIDEGD